MPLLKGKANIGANIKELQERGFHVGRLKKNAHRNKYR